MQKGIYLCFFFAVCLAAVLTACADSPSVSDTARYAEPKTTDAKRVITPTISPIPTSFPTPLPSPTAYEAAGDDTQTTDKQNIDYASVRPYEVGQIMIIMYHGLVETEAKERTYQRSIDNFKNDLQTFYDRGFRLISMKDWLNNNICTTAGYTPLILTFDDGRSTAFSLEYKDGELHPVKDCAVDIMTKFCEKYPDFGNTAMFFINQNPFNGEGTLAERLKYLVDHGYEIGNHTMKHKQMSKISANEIQEEIVGIDKLIKENVPGYEPYAIAYPYGERPPKALYEYILKGEWEGSAYNYRIAVREGQSGPPSAINCVGFDKINVPRVRGTNNQITDMGWMLKHYETHPELCYISDGKPDRIAVPEEFAHNVDKDSLDGKELYIY